MPLASGHNRRWRPQRRPRSSARSEAFRSTLRDQRVEIRKSLVTTMRIYSIVLPISGVFLAACASAPPASLVDARAAYQRASQSEAKDLTPAQLHTAERSLAVAEKTFEDEGASDNARDRAYVAMRKAELAQVQAGIVSAERTTTLAAQRVETAKDRRQDATQDSLDATQAKL